MSDNPWGPIPYPGSFQGNVAFPSEDPRAEVWARLARLGTQEWSSEALSKFGEDSAPLRDYVRTRLRQAQEFREAARGRSIMTSPLMLYYSFLNLTRAFVALKTGEKGRTKHGLHMTSSTGAGFFDRSASVDAGTFSDLLHATGTAAAQPKALSLRDALLSIPELVLAHSLELGHSRVAEVNVTGFIDGSDRVHLTIKMPDLSVQDFRNRWEVIFPSLKGVAELLPAGCGLRITAPVERSYGAISTFCHDHLLNELMIRPDPRWYLLREDMAGALDRSAYYLAAMFILSSAVRYEPDGLSEVVASGSDAAWMLERFVDKADRFFPQLMLSHILGQTLYF